SIDPPERSLSRSLIVAGPRPTGRLVGEHRRIRRSLAAGSAVLLLAAAAAACGQGGTGGGGSGGTAAPEPGGTLVFGIEAETQAWNPTTSRFAISGHTVASSIYDPLMTIDEDGTAQPFLAESVTPNLDFTEWRIRLQDGIRFHDGTPLTASAVKADLDAHRSSALTGAVLDNVADVQAEDELNVVVTMEEPWASFPYMLAANIGYVFAPSMLDDVDGEQT
ncbi:hypothetical protein B7486_70990, partial [cyanobacterium TDX16]